MLLTFAIGCFYFSLFGMAAVLLYRSLLMTRHGRKRRLPADLQAALNQAAEPDQQPAVFESPPFKKDTIGEAVSESTAIVSDADDEQNKSETLASPTEQQTEPASRLAEETGHHAQDDETGPETEHVPSGHEHEEATPQKIMPMLRRVEILIARKEYDEAKKILIRILSWQNDHPDASAHLAYLYLQTSQYGKAETLFRKVLETRLNDASLLTNFALAVLEQKDPEKITDAVEALRMAAKLEPKNAERFSNLGQASYLAGDLEGAVSAFENAVKLAPRNIEYLFFLADSYLAVRNFGFAKRIFGRILEISPLNAEAKQELQALQHLEE